jgi:transposase-like protein
LRESELNWKTWLLRLVDQGFKSAPELAIGDRALGCSKALQQVLSSPRIQRCWLDKTANVLNHLPKSQQPQAKSALKAIDAAAPKADAQKAFDRCIEAFDAKSPQAVQCLTKEREKLLTFFDFPAEHWLHLRTSNPIESTVATVRLTPDKTRGCVSATSILSVVFKRGTERTKALA